MKKYVIINVAGNGISDVRNVYSTGLDFFCLIGDLCWLGRGLLKAIKHKIMISAITIVNIIILAARLINVQIAM